MNPISSDLQDLDLSELKEIYQEELEHSDIYKTLNGKPGLSFRIQISKDKQSYAKVLQADFSKIKKDEFATIYGDQGEEERAEFKKYLNGKPQDLFTYFKDQASKKKNKKSFLSFITTLVRAQKAFSYLFKIESVSRRLSAWTSMVSPVRFDFHFNDASAAFLPTVTRIGSPIKSLSLNLTPARSFRSSTKTS